MCFFSRVFIGGGLCSKVARVRTLATPPFPYSSGDLAPGGNLREGKLREEMERGSRTRTQRTTEEADVCDPQRGRRVWLVGGIPMFKMQWDPSEF